MIINYTGQTIIVNLSQPLLGRSPEDHSLIKNYIPNEKSIILGDKQHADHNLTSKTNMYIMTENCTHSGHFAFSMMRSLPMDPIIYVGIKKGNDVIFSQSDLLPSDVDFGLAKLLDQSNFWVMLMNPLFFVILMFIIVFTVIIGATLSIWLIYHNL